MSNNLNNNEFFEELAERKNSQTVTITISAFKEKNHEVYGFKYYQLEEVKVCVRKEDIDKYKEDDRILKYVLSKLGYGGKTKLTKNQFENYNQAYFKYKKSLNEINIHLIQSEYITKTKYDYKSVQKEETNKAPTKGTKISYIFPTFVEFIQYLDNSEPEELDKYIAYVDKVLKLPKQQKLKVFYEGDLSVFEKSTTWLDRFFNHFAFKVS